MFVSKRALCGWAIWSFVAAAGVALAQHDADSANMLPRSSEAVNGKGGQDLSGPYEPVPGWPESLHPGEWRTGSGRAVYAESPDRIWAVHGGEIPAKKEPRVWGYPIFNDLRFASDHQAATEQDRATYLRGERYEGQMLGRHEHEICLYDRNGKLIESWGEQWHDTLTGDRRGPLVLGHTQRLRVNRYDPERHVWLTSNGVFKLTHDGKKLVMKLGPQELKGGGATDLAFLPNGDFYVQGGSRMIRFSKDGKYLSEFGKPGAGPGEFNGLHGIEIHPDTRRLYIADRTNSRIQVFDENGTLLDIWPNIISPYSIRLTQDGRHLWVGDGFTNAFQKYDLNGKLVPHSTWGTFGIAPGAIWSPHYFDTDSEGSLYVAEDYGARVQKLRPKKDADPADPRLIGQLSR